jgi:hypothetical protein
MDDRVVNDEYYIHADSKNRDLSLFPNGNTYVLNFTKPLTGVVRVDLVSARVPNSMYNLTTNTANLTTSFTTAPFFLEPGFYSASTLEYELNRRLSPGNEAVKYSDQEGKFYYLTNTAGSNVFTNSPELAKMLGLNVGKVYTVAPISVSIDAFYYGVKSERVVDFSLNEYVFLDIEEFRGPYFCDRADNMFAAIPMDVYSGQIKTFKETSDYVVSRQITNRMATVSRLTVNWYDKNLQLLNFQGFENNGFVLRVHCERVTGPPPKLPEETPPVYVPPPPPEQKKKKSVLFGKWAVVIGILGVLLFWYTTKKTV